MEFEIVRSWASLVFLEPGACEYVLLVVYGGLALFLLIQSRPEWAELTRSWRKALLLVGLLVTPLVVNHVVVVRVSSPGLLPPPDIPLEPRQPSVALLSLFPILAAGLWLGCGPALLVGGVSGVLRTGAVIGGVTEPFHLAFFGFVVATCLRQDYRGRLEAAIRQPLVASLLAMSVAGGFLSLSVWASVRDSGLAGLDYTLQVAQIRVGCLLLEALLAGGAFQILYAAYPVVRPVQVPRYLSPLRSSLSRKLLVVVVPLIVFMTLVLVYAVTMVTLRGARDQAERNLARDARNAAGEIPHFIHTGQGLLAEFVRDERLVDAPPARWEALLRSDLRIGALFNQLMLLGGEGQLLALYPPAPTGDPVLTTEEELLLRRALDDGAPQISPGHWSDRDVAIISFLMPVTDDELRDAELGVLIGRVHLQVNPAIGRVLASLQSTSGRGEGFIVDSVGHIIAHPDSGAVLTAWDQDRLERCVADAQPEGLICEGRDPVRNTRELLYTLPADGHPWSVVIRLPYAVVLEQARQVAVPLLLLQTVFGAGLVTATVFLIGRITNPLRRLVGAAELIATGTLTEAVQVTGFDEVGRLGAAFEDMRGRLKERMSDLSLLLEVSQAVSSTLDLATGMSYVLEGALEATDAEVARAVFVTETQAAGMVISRGKYDEGFGAIDELLVAALEDRERPFIAEDLARVEAGTLSGIAVGTVKAALALPVSTKERMLAVVWLGYRSAQQFEKSKLDFLSMLSSQVAVLLENARLFQEVESERSRLAAILESASDAVVVTDRDHRLLLVNPAAEQAFGVRARAVLGAKIDQAHLAPEAVDAILAEPATGRGPREVLLPDGRVLYANVSEIRDSEGERAGRVAVMRDITHFKNLDEMKSEFLATVSHDLRAPLTFMRGYANRLDAVGELNETQESYVQNILHGVQRIDDLVADLLDLSRIEAGLGVERGPCHLGLVLAEAVSGLRSRAIAKDISLRIQGPGDSAAGGADMIVRGDRALIRQAVINLLDNAIKYTPAGGTVSAELSVHMHKGDRRALITVADTGIGIAPDEQARLFEKFYRTKRGDQADASGTGLGLAIVKSIVERHKGKVWVESRLDEGSTFYISLPLLENEPVRPGLSTLNVR